MSNQALIDAMSKVNPKQREAIETIDGPVLVVAGPGTGKTQLLSLRVANILANRDISAENILCLTFTEAGAEAMSKRLARFIGKDAYQVRINTFHAFATYLRSRHIEYFDRSPFDTLITSLQTKKLISRFLMELSVTDPLFNRQNDKGVPSNLGGVIGFIGKVRTSGLSTDELRAIVGQSVDTIEFLETHTDLAARMTLSVPGGKDAKAEFCDELKAKAAIIFESLPPHLTEKIVALPGSHEPLGDYLARTFAETEWYEGKNNATANGFGKLRDAYFDKKTGTFDHKFKKRYGKMLAALDIFDRYRQHLKENGLYDFNDMIFDAIAAIENHEELRQLLQNQYRYILIDEFQDTNGSQMRIVDLLTQGLKCPNIMAVGDDDQAIMRFQGASVAFLKQFEETYAGTRRIVLQTNYRSTPALVKLGQDVAVQIEGRSEASKKDKDLVAFRPETGPTSFDVCCYPSKELQYYEIAKSIRKRIDAGFVRDAANPAEAIAVLSWKHDSLRSLIPYLKMFDIDFNYAIVTTVAKTESLQGLLASLHYVSHLANGDVKRSDPWLPQILAAPELGVSPGEYVHFALAAKKDPGGWTAALAKTDSTTLGAISKRLSQPVKLAACASAHKTIVFLAKPFIEYYQSRIEQDPFAALEFNYGVTALLDFATSEKAIGENSDRAAFALTLGEVMELLSEAERFDENINIRVPVSRPEAITLKTAHNSKGLEYDLVYLLDADEKTWHGAGGGRAEIACPNIYLSEQRDDDDMRRLLFVAITRARTELEMSLGRSGVVAELLEHVEEKPVEPELPDIQAQSMVTWQERYYPDDHALQAMVHSVLAEKRISASFLNAFVEFDADDMRDGSGFVIRQAFDFPRSPVAHFAFGTLAHRYLELYLNHVVKAGDVTPKDLLAKIHAEVDALDFEQAERDHMHEQLNLIAEVFVPEAEAYLNKDAIAEQWIRAEIEGVPLVGRSDLLKLDHERKMIWVCDFKSGSPKNLGAAYLRQLVFYKILIEQSGEWTGWTVSGGMDIFIEPDTSTKELHPPKMFNVPAEDMEHVRKLIKTLYWRLQNADFDTSAFDPAGLDKKEIQRAYENWLIEDYERRS
ncbi:MAG TPA: hypothetical protein DEB24_06715 [Coriobacteriia bacterium]|nr:hypothetical protein [Coriobacteriia bacterium]